MMTPQELLIFATLLVLAPTILAIVVALLARQQNRRVLADRLDTRLHAILEAGSFLERLAGDESVPDDLRRRAQHLVSHYPQGDQLSVLATRLAADLQCRTGRSADT